MATAIMCPACGTPLSSPHSKSTAVLLAVFLSFWTWLYTFQRDKVKFWWGLGLGIFGVITSFFIIGGFILLGVWIWAIVDSATKSEFWYQQYPNPTTR
jgi:hypothetical protein